MAKRCAQEEFAELVAAIEPRLPMLTMLMDTPTSAKKAWEIDITVRLQDSITCNEIGEYTIDPVSALLVVNKMGRFAIDGELCDDEGMFLSMLYDLCNARFTYVLGQLEDLLIPQAEPVSCSVADAIQFVIDAHKRVNGRELVVTIDGAHWSVK